MPNYFYTTRKPHQYNSGPFMTTLNDAFVEIASLDEAREVAKAHAHGRWGQEDFVEVKYGVVYDIDEEDSNG